MGLRLDLTFTDFFLANLEDEIFQEVTEEKDLYFGMAEDEESPLSLSKCSHMATHIQPVPAFYGITVVYEVWRTKRECSAL